MLLLSLDTRIPLLFVVLGLSFLLWHVWVAEVYDVFSFQLYLVKHDFVRIGSR